MTLLNPAALVFLALAPVIVVLYLLKLRRQPASVSTLMFWQRVTADRRRRALFQRLRQILSLLLHLLIFALLLLALARPELRAFRGNNDAGLATVLILDCRARMQTREPGGETRFTQAQRIAEGYLRRASARQPVALLAMNAAPRAVVGLTGEEKSLLDGLATAQPTDAGGRIEDALDLANELLAARAGGRRVVLITDQMPATAVAAAAHEKAPHVPNAPELEVRLAGSRAPRENVGITRLTARALPNSPQTDEVLVEVENFGRQRQAGSVELTFEGQTLDVKPFDLAPGERRADVYPALAAQTGLANARGWLSAHLTLKNPADDAYSPDDDAYAVVPPPQPLRVLLVTRGNWFLEGMLKADDRLQFDQLAPDGFQPAQAAGFDAVVLDDFLPLGFESADGLPPGNFLFLRRTPFEASAAAPVASGATSGTKAKPAVDAKVTEDTLTGGANATGGAEVKGGSAALLDRPAITDLDAASPLLRLVNLRDTTFLRASSLHLPEDLTTPGGWRLAAPMRSLEHALAVTGERRAAGADSGASGNGASGGDGGGQSGQKVQRLAALAFGPADSDLPLRVAFPLLIHNALDWLADRDEAAAAEFGAGVRAGETLRLAAGETLWTKGQRVYGPLLTGNPPPGEVAAGPGVWQPARNGFYLRRAADETRRWLAVNTADREMSAVNAAGVVAAGASGANPADSANREAASGRLAFWQTWLETARVWPPWVYLAVVAFALCTLEWWGFHRRRTE